MLQEPSGGALHGHVADDILGLLTVGRAHDAHHVLRLHVTQLEHEHAYDEYEQEHVDIGGGELQDFVIVLEASVDDAHAVEQPEGEVDNEEQEEQQRLELEGARQLRTRATHEQDGVAKEEQEELERDADEDALALEAALAHVPLRLAQEAHLWQHDEHDGREKSEKHKGERAEEHHMASHARVHRTSERDARGERRGRVVIALAARATVDGVLAVVAVVVGVVAVRRERTSASAASSSSPSRMGEVVRAMCGRL